MTKYYYCHNNTCSKCPDYTIMPTAKNSNDARKIAIREQVQKTDRIRIYSMSPGSKKRYIGSIIIHKGAYYWNRPDDKGVFHIDSKTGRLGQAVSDFPAGSHGD